MSTRWTGPLEEAASEAVRRYVDALRRGRPPATRSSRAAAQRRLARIDVELLTATPMGELKLVQERRDLLELDAWYATEDAFVAVARVYSIRHGITPDTWRTMGVAPAVLRRAGVRPMHRQRPADR